MDDPFGSGGGGTGGGGAGRGRGGGWRWASRQEGASNLWGVPTSTNEVAEIRKIKRNVRQYFDKDPRFVFESVLPGAHHGLAFIVREKTVDANGKKIERKFVVKVATPGNTASIIQERQFLDRFKWALHIVNPYLISDNPLAPLNTPFLVMEFLNHGTLRQFQERTTRANVILPNRILWAIFLCLIRACIGMAYPPKGPAVQLEETRDEEPTTVSHRDMHGGNFVFGMTERTHFVSHNGVVFYEHENVPILKLIDFGESREMPKGEIPVDTLSANSFDKELNLEAHRHRSGRRNQGVDANLLGIGTFGFASNARTLMRSPTDHPSLDRDLQLLVQRCLAADPLNRPRLEEFMTLINNNTFNKTAANYGNAGKAGGLESDETLKNIVSTYILNADTG
ncbi:hypothetical protein F5Y13DRAFT_191395 [Hypoxylon sp. FL1857]|nr:hypothetical protein F5Y13DRAFT_191395 [Hypoxylon sp. FL1857]